MIKKTIVSALALTLLAGLTVGSDLGSYLSTAYHRMTDRVSDTVPIEFQIDRARQLVAELAPEVREAMRVIAKEEIALERLDDQIVSASEQAVQGKDAIVRLQSDLTSGKGVFQYAGRTYTRSQVSEDLSRRFTRHKVADETLAHLETMRDARQGNLEAARLKLTAMISTQKQLEADLVNLEAKRSLVAVAQTATDVALDDSRLARAKELIADIRTRLDVTAKLAHADAAYPGEIQLDPQQSAEITDQVAAYFGLERADAPSTTAVAVSVSKD
ncbi:hypothetical protein [Botrimarina hoheduenensis]|uniref:Chromosome partition protein Smc n=1 Tax=Botrimarina hoheduenensis TaxID=2528000 RepID=A0A5C5W7C2_9BACT|nr:hypothetical protein [Botrimarina hoheduenensis]TWT46768.1 hypothetical protein Pla111_18690 [Botrimarina hoheduenensis]